MNSFDDSLHVASRIARLDLKNGSKLIGYIRSIKYFKKCLILELESGSYYKFNYPRRLSMSLIEKGCSLKLSKGRVSVYILDSCNTPIVDGDSIEEINPHDVFESLLDAIDD